MMTIMAWALALAIATLATKLTASTCGRRLYIGFFRTNPTAASVAALALECTYIALGGGFLVGRVAQLFLGSAFFIARIDVPFISKHASFSFECVSTSFISDILIHEAHRHPYMELFSAMYMMKLKNENFGSEAGASWRQLFVLSLMPWLSKWRVINDLHQATDLKETLIVRQPQSPSSSAPEDADGVTHSFVNDEQPVEEYAA